MPRDKTQQGTLQIITMGFAAENHASGGCGGGGCERHGSDIALKEG